MVKARYLLDTDWAVYYLRGKEPFVDNVKRYRQKGLAISVISMAELYEGVFRSTGPKEKEASLNDFLTGLSILNVTKPVARAFGRQRAELRKKGLLIGDLDLIIACTAQYHGLTVLTNNKKHYEKVLNPRKIISLET